MRCYGERGKEMQGEVWTSMKALTGCQEVIRESQRGEKINGRANGRNSGCACFTVLLSICPDYVNVSFNLRI